MNNLVDEVKELLSLDDEALIDFEDHLCRSPAITLSFVPSNLGTSMLVKCKCGQEKEINI